MLIFDKSIFKNKSFIKKWLKARGYKILKSTRKTFWKNDGDILVRLREPSKFNKSTFKTKKIRKGVKEITGFLK